MPKRTQTKKTTRPRTAKPGVGKPRASKRRPAGPTEPAGKAEKPKKPTERAGKSTGKATGKSAGKSTQTRSGKPARPRPAKRRATSAPKNRPAAGPERLQKVLAAAGIGSRRDCEELITAGRVEVDRRVVTELGTKVDPASQEIRLDGVALPRPKRVYYALNKPTGVLSTNRDPSGRPRVTDLVPDETRLFCVGRLDLHSEGLILLTNDGELANRLTHPRYGVEKVYRVQVAGRPTPEVLARLRRGIHLAEGLARVERARIKSRQKESTILEMVLREGHNREIRRVLARLEHKVLRLVRVSVGPIRLGDLPPGAFRKLSPQEVTELRRAAYHS